MTKKKRSVYCPRCSSLATKEDSEYGVKHSCCNLWSYNYKPLVDGETHSLRIRAHMAFDPLWKSGAMTRGEAYQELQVALGMTAEDCHMGKMNKQDLRCVFVAVRRIKERLAMATLASYQQPVKNHLR